MRNTTGAVATGKFKGKFKELADFDYKARV